MLIFKKMYQPPEETPQGILDSSSRGCDLIRIELSGENFELMAKPKRAITVHRVVSESPQAAKETCIPRGKPTQ